MVNIILATYNGEKYIEQQLSNLLTSLNVSNFLI